MHILLVEDNPLNLELETDLLELGGHQVTQAETGEKALELARQQPFDLILIDVSLPGKDGLTVTSELKSDPQTRDIPVIAVTAHAMVGDKERVMSVGCLGYLTKPIDTRTFVRDIEAFMPS